VVVVVVVVGLVGLVGVAVVVTETKTGRRSLYGLTWEDP